MNFKICAICDNKQTIMLPQPIWFCHTINNKGTNICFDFTFTEQIQTNIIKTKINWELDGSEHEETFLVDEIKTIYSSKTKFFHLKLSHPVCYVWKNNVEPQNFTNFSSTDLLNNFCKPYNISLVKNFKNIQTSSFLTTLGMTYWDAISIFFKKTLNSTVFLNNLKQVTPKFQTKKPNILNENKQYITHIEKIEDRTKLLSKIIIHQPDDKPEKFTISSGINQIALNKGIERTKFFNLPKQYSLFPNRGSQLLIDKYNADHKTIEIRLAKTIDAVWPGSEIYFEDENSTIKLCVDSFQTSLTQQGPHTTIGLLYNDLII